MSTFNKRDPNTLAELCSIPMLHVFCVTHDYCLAILSYYANLYRKVVCWYYSCFALFGVVSGCCGVYTLPMSDGLMV